MTIWQRLFGWMKNVSKAVWDFVGPLVLSLVRVEAAGYISLVLGIVTQAEAQFGSGAGQAKYDWTIQELKRRLGSQFAQTPYRVWDSLIHAAVAKISA
jgi:hypothetical protein